MTSEPPKQNRVKTLESPSSEDECGIQLFELEMLLFVGVAERHNLKTNRAQRPTHENMSFTSLPSQHWRKREHMNKQIHNNKVTT